MSAFFWLLILKQKNVPSPSKSNPNGKFLPKSDHTGGSLMVKYQHAIKLYRFNQQIKVLKYSKTVFFFISSVHIIFLPFSLLNCSLNHFHPISSTDCWEFTKLLMKFLPSCLSQAQLTLKELIAVLL
jgi:hypothetical protein